MQLKIEATLAEVRKFSKYYAGNGKFPDNEVVPLASYLLRSGVKIFWGVGNGEVSRTFHFPVGSFVDECKVDYTFEYDFRFNDVVMMQRCFNHYKSIEPFSTNLSSSGNEMHFIRKYGNGVTKWGLSIVLSIIKDNFVDPRIWWNEQLTELTKASKLQPNVISKELVESGEVRMEILKFETLLRQYGDVFTVNCVTSYRKEYGDFDSYMKRSAEFGKLYLRWTNLDDDPVNPFFE